jgi:hypothetical protein
MQNFPNPFYTSTVISYQLSDFNYVSLKIFDINGNEVSTLVNENKPAGKYEVNFNASSLPVGVYFYRLSTNEKSLSKKFLLVK